MRRSNVWFDVVLDGEQLYVEALVECVEDRSVNACEITQMVMEVEVSTVDGAREATAEERARWEPILEKLALAEYWDREAADDYADSHDRGSREGGW